MTIACLKFYVALATLMALSPTLAAAEQFDQVLPSAAAGHPDTRSTKPVKRVNKTHNSPWTIQDALPAPSAALRPDPTSAEPGLGRVPLRSGQGSFGFETETHVKTNPGTVIPSLQANESRIRPFMGLSLTVPTSGK
jgi:hypothetical protein